MTLTKLGRGLAVVVWLWGPVALAQAPVETNDAARSESHFALAPVLGVTNGFGQVSGTAFGQTFISDTTTYGLGVMLGYFYEAERFGIGAQLSGFIGAPFGVASFGDVYGLFYLLPGATWSPYVGGGFGYMATSNLAWCATVQPDGAGAAAEAQLGVELARNSHTHVQVGAQALIPFYRDDTGTYPLGGVFVTRVLF